MFQEAVSGAMTMSHFFRCPNEITGGPLVETGLYITNFMKSTEMQCSNWPESVDMTEQFYHFNIELQRSKGDGNQDMVELIQCMELRLTSIIPLASRWEEFTSNNVIEKWKIQWQLSGYSGRCACCNKKCEKSLFYETA